MRSRHEDRDIMYPDLHMYNKVSAVIFILDIVGLNRTEFATSLYDR